MMILQVEFSRFGQEIYSSEVSMFPGWIFKGIFSQVDCFLDGDSNHDFGD